MSKKRSSSGNHGRHRSAITGRYISAAAAARHPKTSVTEAGRKKKR